MDLIVAGKSGVVAIQQIGYAGKYPAQKAYDLRNRVLVREAIEERDADYLANANLSRTKIIRELSRIGFAKGRLGKGIWRTVKAADKTAALKELATIGRMRPADDNSKTGAQIGPGLTVIVQNKIVTNGASTPVEGESTTYVAFGLPPPGK